MSMDEIESRFAHPPDCRSRTPEGEIEAFQYMYGSRLRDQELLRYSISHPRYTHLGRKVLRHYLGELYDPHTIFTCKEVFIRLCIKDIVEYKVFNKVKGYDWAWIDQFFKMTFTITFGVEMPFDMEWVQRGPDPEFLVPEHEAIFSFSTDETMQ